ncbi:unnamed protein product [Linum trigynum]|uniref:Uncharacterized protein n=1 Tax=Linum trigynum TaxID=586398 RepID=A0AAV2DM04_9ROSI
MSRLGFRGVGVAYTVIDWAEMWGDQPAPSDNLLRGPDHASIYGYQDVLRIVRGLGLPPHWQYAVPSARSMVGNCPAGWFGVYTEYWVMGFKFPIDPLLCALYRRLNCSVGRLSPSVIMHASCLRLACKRLKIEPTYGLFRKFYKIKDPTRRSDCLSIKRRDKRPEGFVYGSPKLKKTWFERFFYVKPTPGEWASEFVAEPTEWKKGGTVGYESDLGHYAELNDEYEACMHQKFNLYDGGVV